MVEVYWNEATKTWDARDVPEYSVYDYRPTVEQRYHRALGLADLTGQVYWQERAAALKERLVPTFVRVSRAGLNTYRILCESTGELLFQGNREQVHSWLGQHDYKQSRLVGDIEGGYKRAA